MALNLTTKKEGSALAVALEGELNTTTAPELKDLLDKSIPETDALSLDFAGCDFVSSAGLRAMKRANIQMRRKGGTLALKNVTKPVMEVLELTGFAVVFKII